MNVGETIGNYRILGELGRGGMGVVYKAEQINLGRFVALKALYQHLCSDPVTIMRFNREARTTALLNHPNVVQIYDVGQHEDIHFFAMEFIPGRTLAQILQQRGALPVQEVIRIVDQIAAGLGAGHDVGLVHRDVKPSNIIITDDGRVKVTDFGIALVTGQGELTDTGHLVGTARYMAPEQARGDDLDNRSDLYSLGVVLFEMLAGRVPFHDDNPVTLLNMHVSEPVPDLAVLAPNVPPAVVGLVTRLLQKAPADRFRNVRQFRAELRRATAEIEWTGPSLPPLESAPETSEVDPGFVFDAAGPLRQTADTVTLFVVDKVAPNNRLLGRFRRFLERLISARLQRKRDSYKLQKLDVVRLRDQFTQASVQLEAVKEECDRIYKKWEGTNEALHDWQMKGSLALREYRKFEAEEAGEEEKLHWRRATAYKLQWHSLQEQVRDWYTNVERARQDYEHAKKDLDALSKQRKIASDRSGVTRRNRIMTAVLLAIVLAALVFVITRVWGSASAAASVSADFRKVGMLTQPRDESAATLLPDGNVLVVGGSAADGTPSSAAATAETFDPALEVFKPTQPLNDARFNHTVDSLADGSVLVIGGESPKGNPLRSVEEYSPRERRFARTAILRIPRCRHRSLVLADGRLMVCGGRGSTGDLVSVEIYDAASHRFSNAGNLVAPRKDHTLTLLPDGRVLVIGGSQSTGKPLDSIELYDPRAQASAEIGRLQKPRYEHTTSLLPDGKVLVIGGRQGQHFADMLNDTELVDPASGSSSYGPSLAFRRKVHTATVTTSQGRPGILVVGGGSEPGSQVCEFYDFNSGKLLVGPKLNYNRNNHFAVLLADGSLLVAGGYGTDARTALQTAERYTPARPLP